MKVFVSTHPFAEVSSDPLELMKEKGIEVELNPYGRKIRCEELIKHIRDKDFLIAGTETLDREILDCAPNLKLIARVGIGIDGIDFDETKKKDILVTYTPDAVTNAVAELTICNILNLARAIPSIDRGMRNGKWVRPAGFELRGKKVGIIGFGRIGQSVAKLLYGFSCVLYANDISPDQEIASKFDVKFASKSFIYQECDIITIHIPKTPLTEKLITENVLKVMKKSALLLNTSRGGIVDEDDLYQALKNGIIMGAALDVYEREPYISERLCELDNVILTCHSGSCTNEARYLMELGAAREVVEFYEDRPPISAVPDETIIGERAVTVASINAEWHELSNTSVERMDNRYKLYRRRWTQYPTHFIVGKYPLHVDIEAVQRHDILNPLGFDYIMNPVEQSECTFMDMQLFSRIIQEISQYTEPVAVKLGFRGDPVLHPHLDEMISLCHKAGSIETIVSTCASPYLEERIECLMGSGLDILTLYIKFRENYENSTLEEKHSIDSICNVLDRIRRIKATLDKNNPTIRLLAEVDPHDIVGIKQLNKFWSNWADVVAVTDRMSNENKFCRKQSYPWACSKLWRGIVVTADGDILPCNNDGREQINLGHLFDVSIKSAWHSHLLSEIRGRHMVNKSNEVSTCSNCSFRQHEIREIRV